MRDLCFRAWHGGRGVPRRVGDCYFRFDESLRRWDLNQEAEVRDCIETNCTAGGVAIDIGANFGMHTLVMASQVGPGGQVIAFEPIPENLRLLRRNIDLNRFHNRVRIFESAISDLAQPRIAMNVDSDSLEPSASIVTATSECVSLSVDNQSLDTALADVPDGRDCFIKIDVEGAELSVLRSGIGFLKRVRPKLLIEIHDYALPQFGDSTEAAYAFLCDHGYMITQISDMANHNGKYHHILALPIATMTAANRSK